MFILSGVFFLMAQLSLKLCAISNVYIANSIIFRPSNSIHTLLCTVYHTLLCTVYLVRYRRPWMCVCDTKCFVFSPFLSIPSLPLLAFSPLQCVMSLLGSISSSAVDGKSLWTHLLTLLRTLLVRNNLQTSLPHWTLTWTNDSFWQLITTLSILKRDHLLEPLTLLSLWLCCWTWPWPWMISCAIDE